MSINKSLDKLSLNDAPPPLPSVTPPPPVATPPVPAPKEVDESLIQQQLLSSSRLNNVDLLTSIISEVTDKDRLAYLINTTKDFSGNTPLHLCCKYGSYEVLDIILDQEGVEVDPLNRESETPIFLAVQYSKDEPEHGQYIIETMIDAGCDVTSKNNQGLRPVDLVPKDNKELITIIENAEYVEEFDVSEYKAEVVEDVEGSEGESGSESESE